MQQIYVRITGSTPGYLDWRDLWVQHDYLYDTYREKELRWDQFLRAFYLRKADTGSLPRDEFYNEAGIARSTLDWQAWRELIDTP